MCEYLLEGAPGGVKGVRGLTFKYASSEPLTVCMALQEVLHATVATAGS